MNELTNSDSIFQSFKVNDIVTIGCEDHLQKRNTLKGLAMQKLVCHSLGSENENDISLRKIFNNLKEIQNEYFLIEKPFRTQDKKFLSKWSYVHLTDFVEYIEIWIRERIIDKSWKVCNFCGQKIRSNEQFSKKCWKCKKGWFQVSEEKKSKWVLLNKGSKQRMIDFLLKNGFLKTVQIRKRLDFFTYSNNVFSIFEAKNKENTGLTVADLRKTLIYPFIIYRTGYDVKNLLLIYNGEISPSLRKELKRGYGSNFPFSIELCHISEFLKRNAVSIKEIHVKQVNDQYFYELIPGQTNNIIINLTAIQDY